MNDAEEESFVLILPTALLAAPIRDEAIALDALNSSGVISIIYQLPPGETLDSGSVLDTSAEFTLSGAGASGVTVNGKPTLVNGVYEYTFTGNFTPGPITLNFVADSFADSGGATNEASTESFDVYKVMANLAVPLDTSGVDVATLNERGYIDITFNVLDGRTVNTATILDAPS